MTLLLTFRHLYSDDLLAPVPWVLSLNPVFYISLKLITFFRCYEINCFKEVSFDVFLPSDLQANHLRIIFKLSFILLRHDMTLKPCHEMILYYL